MCRDPPALSQELRLALQLLTRNSQELRLGLPLRPGAGLPTLVSPPVGLRQGALWPVRAPASRHGLRSPEDSPTRGRGQAHTDSLP